MGSYQEDSPDADVYLTDDIETLARSPYGQSHDGQKIVNLLRDLKGKSKIIFADIDARGDEDGETIRVKGDYMRFRCRAIPILAHEGAHMVFRKQKDDVVLDELRSQLIELEVYAWLKSGKTGCSAVPDPVLEARMSCLDSTPKGPYSILGIANNQKYLRLKTRITNELANSDAASLRQ